MPVINFKEIPEAHISSGQQDSFELFCQEFMKFRGLEIVSGPDRGADGGIDLLCKEQRKGSFGITPIMWLVSCKHKAHSGRSVTPQDEQNIIDRLRQHKADGFIGFYSTLPSAGLSNRLDSYRHNDKYEIMIFNSEQIEEALLESPKGQFLFKRFFKLSYEAWKRNERIPVKLYSQYEPLCCMNCGADILSKAVEESKGSLIGFVRNHNFSQENGYKKEKFDDIYFSCKGVCDNLLNDKYSDLGYTVDWKDISDLKIPVEFMRWIMALLNNYQDESVVMEEQAFEKLKSVIMSLGQYTMRDLTDDEDYREDILNMLPEWLR